MKSQKSYLEFTEYPQKFTKNIVNGKIGNKKIGNIENIKIIIKTFFTDRLGK